MFSSRKVINLALQGGGAHGAFTWGVLERLLEREDIALEGISGSSSGAMNAVRVAYGYTQDGRDGARELLARFWERVAGLVSLDPPVEGLLSYSVSEPPPWLHAYLEFSRLFSPYLVKPSGYTTPSGRSSRSWWISSGCRAIAPMYLENNLVKPRRLRLLGTYIDLGEMRCPCYVVAALQGHITPWPSVHRAQRFFSGATRLVLAEHGHITGIVNPPGSGRGAYYTNDSEMATDPETWLAGATRHPGSWWPEWVRWLRARSADKRLPPALGNAKYPPLLPAPGRYVLEH